MAFELPPLPYDYSALEPHIDAQTMQIHHDRHHGTYVTNVNGAIEKHPELASKSVEELLGDLSAVPDDIRTVVRNNGGGHLNHSIFWTIMGPNGGGAPSGRLGDAITSTFGSYDSLKEQLQKAGLGQFGSGWAWVLSDSGGKLLIKSYPNQDSPYSENLTPIFGVDVWEHAYYLKYQNKRADYITAWFNTLNWKAIEARYK
jgi:Fe-Mn family superoxide dismutase